MEILNDFGFDPILLGAQIINFLIIFFVLRKFFYKPILEMLQKRQQTIEVGIKQAEEAAKLLERTTEKEKVILKTAQAEAKKLLDEAKQQRMDVLKQTEQETKKQAEIILKEAKAQIVYESKEAEKRLAAHVSELTVIFLQKALVGLFTEQEQDMIMKNALRKMKGKAD